MSSPTNPTDATTEDRKHSIYATYTASGGVANPSDLIIGDKNVIIGDKNLIVQ